MTFSPSHCNPVVSVNDRRWQLGGHNGVGQFGVPVDHQRHGQPLPEVEPDFCRCSRDPCVGLAFASLLQNILAFCSSNRLYTQPYVYVRVSVLSTRPHRRPICPLCPTAWSVGRWCHSNLHTSIHPLIDRQPHLSLTHIDDGHVLLGVHSRAIDCSDREQLTHVKLQFVQLDGLVVRPLIYLYTYFTRPKKTK